MDSLNAYKGYTLIDGEKNLGESRDAFSIWDFDAEKVVKDQDGKIACDQPSFDAAEKAKQYLLGNKTETIRHLFGMNAEELSAAHSAAKVSIMEAFPFFKDVLFMCGNKFDSASSLQVLPIEIIVQILKAKNAAILNVVDFQSEINRDFYKALGFSKLA